MAIETCADAEEADHETKTVHRDQRGELFMKDPIHEEIHKYREERARKFNFDLAAICKDLRGQSRNLNVVPLPPKRITAKRENRVCPYYIAACEVGPSLRVLLHGIKGTRRTGHVS